MPHHVLRQLCLLGMRDPRDEPVYVISVAARLAGLPTWFLRVLDDEGIVVPLRTESNRRLYSDNDITLLARVRHLTEERGVNIAGVKVILEMERDRSSAREQEESSSPSLSAPTAPPEDTTSGTSVPATSAPLPFGALPPYPIRNTEPHRD